MTTKRKIGYLFDAKFEILEESKSAVGDYTVCVTSNFVGKHEYRKLILIDEKEVLEQSCIKVNKPSFLVYEHLRVMALALLQSMPRNVLILGNGGGDFYRFLMGLGITNISCVEYDKQVVYYSNIYFECNNTVHTKTALDFIKFNNSKYDLIIVDLYNAKGSNQIDLEMWYLLLKRLSKVGMVVVNWADYKNYLTSIIKVGSMFKYNKLLYHKANKFNLIQILSNVEINKIDSASYCEENFNGLYKTLKQTVIL